MKPAIRPIRAQSRPICHFCDYTLQQPAHRRSFLTASTLKAPSLRRQPAKQDGVLFAAPTRRFASATKARRVQQLEPEIEHPGETANNSISLNKRLEQVEKRIEAITTSPRVEPEEATLDVLQSLESIAKQAIAIRTGQPPSPKLNLRQSSAGAILSLGDDALKKKKPSSKPSTARSNDLPTPAYLSNLAENLLKHPQVFISPSILSKYVDLQHLLGRPRTIPEIFYLYANKPVPELGSSPPKYLKPSPKGHKQAIPADIAYKALTAAIEAKDLPLALNVIDTTYCAPAWRRYKMLTKVGPPALFATITPFALYMIASELSLYSGYLDPWTFKMYSFAGLLTYVGCTGTLGFVAMTTANDHHDRVVWAPGQPLTDRWLREDERAALDRIACAWGFKEHWKRGDEEGEDWEGLRQWCLLKDMILDKTDLMPGMNTSR